MRRAGIICKREKGHLGAGGRGEVRMRMRGENNADRSETENNDPPCRVDKAIQVA